MNTSSRFVVAVHSLVMLTLRGRETSDVLSKSVNTNPVVIRRILSELQAAGLVRSRTGPNGGSELARPASEITLLDVYEAVDDGTLFHLHYQPPRAACPVGGNIQASLDDLLTEARAALKHVLEQRTLQAVADDIAVRSGIDHLLKQGVTPAEIEVTYRFRNGRAVKRPAKDPR